MVKDPVTKNVNGGDNTTFRIAVDRNYVPKGKDKPDTDFFDVCLWNSCAKYAAKYYKKGNQVYVLGSIENNNYEGKNGKVFSDRVNGTETGFAEGRNKGIAEFAVVDIVCNMLINPSSIWVRLHSDDELFKKRCGGGDFDAPEDKVLERIEIAKIKTA